MKFGAISAAGLLAVASSAPAKPPGSGKTHTKVRATPRVIGGNNAPDGKYPWVVALDTMIKGDSSLYSCGGTLINKQYVLTAAHCFYPARTGSAGTAYLGSHQACYDDAAGCDADEKRTIEKVFLHPDYNDNTLANDIAVLRLDSPVTSVDPVAYSDAEFDANEAFTEAAAEVLGWGLVNEKKDMMAKVLQVGEVELVSRDDCTSRPFKYSVGDIERGMVCAYNNNRVDACQGDSGGPLYLPGANKVVGVVSWGEGCAKKKYPGVYADVGRYHAWLGNIIDGDSSNANGGNNNAEEQDDAADAGDNYDGIVLDDDYSPNGGENATCECMDRWSFDGRTYSGCAAADDDQPWCYVKDSSCSGAEASSTWDFLSWKYCGIPDKQPKTCSRHKKKGKCNRELGADCEWKNFRCREKLVCPAGSDACCGMKKEKCKQDSECKWMRNSICMPW